MELKSQSKQEESEELEKLRRESGAEVEIIKGVVVFTIETANKEALMRVVNLYGKDTVFRIINANFVDDAIEFGTDKGRVDDLDFRRVAAGAGFDVWGVEKKALELGLSKMDVFCGVSYDFFVKEGGEYSTTGLGIPEDRSAVLIFDRQKLKEIKDTDGFVFTDINNKKGALLGIVRFKETFVEFETELNSLQSADEKIQLLEREIWQNLTNEDDLKRAPYLALHIIGLLYQESLKNAGDPSSIERINKLKSLSDRLAYEVRMIENVENMEGQIGMTRRAFASADSLKMELMRTWPDFVIETTNDYLNEAGLDEKYRLRLLGIVEDAKRCKEELRL